MSDWDDDDSTHGKEILNWAEELKEQGKINEWRYKTMCDWAKGYNDLQETVRRARIPNQVHMLRILLEDQKAISASYRWSQQLAEQRLASVQAELEALRAQHGK